MASPSHTPDELLATLRVRHILQAQQTFQQDLTALTTKVTQIRTRIGPSGFNHHGPEQPFAHPIAPTSIKLDIPRFDGKDPLNWIFKINQFFEFHHTPEDPRICNALRHISNIAIIV